MMRNDSGETTVVLRIDGMSCAGCAAAVERALSGVDGVVSASVDVAAKEAHVQYRPGTAGRDDLVGAVRSAGYSVDE